MSLRAKVAIAPMRANMPRRLARADVTGTPLESRRGMARAGQARGSHAPDEEGEVLGRIARARGGGGSGVRGGGGGGGFPRREGGAGRGAGGAPRSRGPPPCPAWGA